MKHTVVAVTWNRGLSMLLAVMVMCGASTIAYAVKTCYCNSAGPISACANVLLPCFGAGADCTVDAGGSDLIWQTTSSTERGFATVTLGALGTCRY